MIHDKATARQILLAAAQELNELEFDQMAAFYQGGPNTSTGLALTMLAHTWASIAKNALIPLGSLDMELARNNDGDAARILRAARVSLAKLDTAS